MKLLQLIHHQHFLKQKPFSSNAMNLGSAIHTIMIEGQKIYGEQYFEIPDIGDKRKKENENLESSKSEIGWGHQIRSYVLQPYQLVKDLRNKTENTNPDAVLNGDIDSFIEAGVLNK